MDLSPASVLSLQSSGFPVQALQPLQQLPVQSMVTALKEALTTERSEPAAVGIFWRACLRREGTEASLLPRDDITSESLSVIVRFLAGKSEAYRTAEQAYEGLAAIVTHYIARLPEEATHYLLSEWFPGAGVQRQSASCRAHAFRMLDCFTQHRMADVVGAGGPFLKGFIAVCEGEQDPGNVLIAFRCNGRIASAFPANVMVFYASDMFDTLSAYFPVLFTPSPGSTVTKADLRAALHASMCSDAYTEYCLPFLCTKFTSPATVTKHDCLEVLTASLQRLASSGDEESAVRILPLLAELLPCLRGEILKMSALGGDEADGAVMQGALEALCLATQSIRFLSPADLLSSLSPIVTAAVSTVESGSPAGRAYASMMHAVAAASPGVCLTILEYLIPLLISIAESVSPTTAQMDGVVAISSALLASAERCCASGLNVSPPSPKTLSALTTLILTVAQNVDGKDGAISNFSLCCALEACATLCALSSRNPDWFPADRAIATYHMLARTSFGPVAPPGDAAARASKACANAMRVDGDRAVAAVDHVAATEVYDRKRLFFFCERMMEVPAVGPIKTSLCRTIQLVPTTEDEWAIVLRGASRLLTVAKSREDGAVDEACRCALHAVSSLAKIESQKGTVYVTRLLIELLPAMDEQRLALLVAEQESDPTRHAVLVAAIPIRLASPFPVPPLLATELGGTPTVLLPLKGLLIAQLPLAERTACFAAALATAPDVSSLELAQLVKAAAIRSDDARLLLEKKLFERVHLDPVTGALACASVLSYPCPKPGGAVAADWDAGYLARCLSYLGVLQNDAATLTDAGLRATRMVCEAAQPSLVLPLIPDLVSRAVSSLDHPHGGDAAALLSVLAKINASAAVESIAKMPTAAMSIARIGSQAVNMATRASCFNLLAQVARALLDAPTPSLKDDPRQQRTPPTFASLAAQVADALRPSLDDPKRVVRQAAAAARHYWLLLQASSTKANN